MNEELKKLTKQVEEEIKPQFKEIDERCEKNSLKVITAFQESNLQEMHLNSSTGYGIDEPGRNKIEEITGHSIIKTVQEAEPIGPKAMLDLLVILPCTGNSLAKLSNGIADTSVTMAAKAHLRNSRPVLIAVSTNDALGCAAKNIGSLMNYKNIYFLPFAQDDCEKKPNSLVADFSKLNDACEAALDSRQLQPLLLA